MFFVYSQGQKIKQTRTAKNFFRQHDHSPLLTMVCGIMHSTSHGQGGGEGKRLNREKNLFVQSPSMLTSNIKELVCKIPSKNKQAFFCIYVGLNFPDWDFETVDHRYHHNIYQSLGSGPRFDIKIEVFSHTLG